MRVLVACEFSERVRDAFTIRGHDAMSCDLLPSDTPGKHFQGDIRKLLNEEWDLLIAHPPCTFLTVSNSAVITRFVKFAKSNEIIPICIN